MNSGSQLIEKLLVYAKQYLYLNDYDVNYKRNILMRLLKVTNIGECADCRGISRLNLPDPLLKELEDYAISEGITDDIDALKCEVMGILSPLPSEVNFAFNYISEKEGAMTACKYLHTLGVKNYYIREADIKKNLRWTHKGKRDIEITVNLAKPEKNNKDIANLLKKNTDSLYPRCMLCKENEGFYGREGRPSRYNLRTVSINLDQEDWFIQFSPYSYYEEHLIAVSNHHSPMKIDFSTFKKLAEFADKFPHYFIGSNSCIPIVGGSILDHEHFQGGLHKMPICSAKSLKKYSDTKFPDVEITVLDWFNSAIRLRCKNRDNLAGAAYSIFKIWENYDDESCDIISHTKKDGSVTLHNSVTPICRKDKSGNFEMDLILRNNRTSEEYPDGIFHSHPEYHNIKKEGIGLIEAMGYFILPGRLKRQTDIIADILIKSKTEEEVFKEDEGMAVHRDFIKKLKTKYSKLKNKEQALKKIYYEIGEVCIEILKNTAVFKEDEKGKSGFEKFIAATGAVELK